MSDWFLSIHPAGQAFVAAVGTWTLTAAGAAVVFLFRSVSKTVLDTMVGFAAGVMIAASFWSLLAPAIAMTVEAGGRPWVPALVGFAAGGAFLWVADRILPHVHPGFPAEEAEGIDSSLHRSALLVLAITLHNIPEGLAIGVAFGGVAAGVESLTLGGAAALAIGIGLQNLPEGTAVAVPLFREGFTRRRAFFYGQASALVEPVAAVVGAATVLTIQPVLPYALSFAAGSMIYVVVEELVPESQALQHSDWPTVGAMVGFCVMMVLDVALG